MNDPRRPNRVRAARAAEELLHRLGVDTLPVEVEGIARDLRVPIEPSDLPAGVYGAVAHDGARTRIVVSTACPTHEHRRYTIAHEIGHCVIEGHAEQLFEREQIHLSNDSPGARRHPLEIEADAFAALLLMPAPLVRPITAAGPSLAVVRAVSTKAQVSLTAAAIRCTELIAEAFAAVLSQKGRIEWVSFSAGMRDHPWARRSRSGESVPPGSPTMQLAKQPARIAASGSDDGETGLTDWFPGAPAVLAAEEAVGLGEYGRVLTVLVPSALPTVDQLEHARRREQERAPDWRDALRTFQWDDPDEPES